MWSKYASSESRRRCHESDRENRMSARSKLLMVLCLGFLWTGTNLGSAEEEAIPTRSSRSAPSTSSRSASAADRSTRTPETSNAARIEAKVDQILASQEQILARLDQDRKSTRLNSSH